MANGKKFQAMEPKFRNPQLSSACLTAAKRVGSLGDAPIVCGGQGRSTIPAAQSGDASQSPLSQYGIRPIRRAR